MLSRIAQTFVSVGVIAALLFITMQPALAAPEQRQPKLSDFFWEEVGMGAVGATLGLSLLAWSYYGCPAGILDFLGTRICKNSPSDASLPTAVYSLLFGIPVGATVGVIFMGSQHGVQGSSIPATVGLAYLGMIVGLSGGFFVGGSAVEIIKAICRDCVESLISGVTSLWLVSTALAGAAIFAALGYNIGAKMESDKSKPAALSWHMPLISVKF